MQDAGTQTDESVALEIVGQNRPSSSKSVRSGLVAPAGTSAAVPWKVPPPNPPVRDAVVFDANSSVILTRSAARPVTQPHVLARESRGNLIRRAHVSDETGVMFLSATFLTDPRNRAHPPRRAHPRDSFRGQFARLKARRDQRIPAPFHLPAIPST